jgi:hypothetical protein
VLLPVLAPVLVFPVVGPPLLDVVDPAVDPVRPPVLELPDPGLLPEGGVVDVPQAIAHMTDSEIVRMRRWR